MWSFFQIFFAVGKGRKIFEIVLSTVATISFVVIVMFAVITRRLYMKNMTYREIEQGEYCNNWYPISFIASIEHSDSCIQTMETFSCSLNMVLLAICLWIFALILNKI